MAALKKSLEGGGAPPRHRLAKAGRKTPAKKAAAKKAAAAKPAAKTPTRKKAS